MFFNVYIHYIILYYIIATDLSVQTRTIFDKTVLGWTCMNNNLFIYNQYLS